ncbi:MAG: hypothetical protein NVSMB51_20150 [Solirubrobacteraceae bacterium]
MQLATPRFNVELRAAADGERFVVLSFPYDPAIVARVRSIPNRRFDWDSREWSAPVDDWVGVHVSGTLATFPELTRSPEVQAWLSGIEQRWVARVSAVKFDGRGWWRIDTLAGAPPGDLADGARTGVDDVLLAPLTVAGGEALRRERSIRIDSGAERCIADLELGDEPPPARLTIKHGVGGRQFHLEVLWDADAGRAFEALPGAVGRLLPIDPWLLERLEELVALHAVQVTQVAREQLDELRVEHDQAAAAIRRSRSVSGEPIEAAAAVLGGELRPFQWAGVRYALAARSTFIADEQGLGKTVEALAAIEADQAFPAVVVCPASLKLNWQREAESWLPHRSVAVLTGRAPAKLTSELTILNYEIVAAHRVALGRLSPAALVIDESHLVKNPRAKRTQAVRRLAAQVKPGGLRLALTGTPVLNHADELIAQLRVIGRLEDFGSGARFSRQFQGALSAERLHWHLRRRCFVRRLKAEVLPQLPAKRQVVVPMELSNEPEYRLAERDVIAWLREQPLELRELNARVAAALRAERLAQLRTLQRLAARGKLHAALAWIHDFLQSGEPLVVFAHHVEVQEAVRERFPRALHLLGADPPAAREAAIAAFQDPAGEPLIICATRVAAQGITLTRASNVAFLELEWTPAMHDQAEDRCHRIGQRDAVCAWYLLAANTIDETMARLIQSKRETVAAVTDGAPAADDGLLAGVVRELRDGEPYRHLRPVA